MLYRDLGKKKCRKCKHCKPLAVFAWNDHTNTKKKRAEYLLIVGKVNAAIQDGDFQRAADLQALAEGSVDCQDCRNKNYGLSKAQQACKDFYDNARHEACMANNGCAHASCPMRGMACERVLTMDHGTNEKARATPTGRYPSGKPICLSDYKRWPAQGGVAAMQAELQKVDKWICVYCHGLEKTSRAGLYGVVDPATMPDGRKGNLPTHDPERIQFETKAKMKIKYPKYLYVDARKRAIGACAACCRPVKPGEERAFHFDHLDEATKCKGGYLFGPGGGVCGIVGSVDARAKLEKVQCLIDAEIAKCQLLCANCHHCKTKNLPALPKWE